ncbi:hypothetical protein C8R45DRAFT_1095109 [Mycena sanguinolenta]|nr:hypothetical protein C8R45DRAFT_1095109 [Mycena sanguinolenta]
MMDVFSHEADSNTAQLSAADCFTVKSYSTPNASQQQHHVQGQRQLGEIVYAQFRKEIDPPYWLSPGEETLQAHLNNMAAEDREGLDRLQSLMADNDFHAGDSLHDINMVNLKEVLDGSERIELSHGGGEFSSLGQDIEADLGEEDDEKQARKREDWRTHRDRTEICNCTFQGQMPATLVGEDTLIFDMLTTMDGNNSLKRVLQREKVAMADSEMGVPVLGKSRERVDNRDTGDGYYVLREQVERWASDRLAQTLPMQTASMDEENPCTDRCKNMINDVTSKLWRIFDQTADMIKSGELAKYPLAVVKELLDAFGMKLGAGYDVGCHFEATVTNSELSDELLFLATYVEGVGLEDLEGCEQFSRSNSLAKSCQYASRFHRQQEITTYTKHFDSFETYVNLSKFLCTNYQQALTILKTESALRVWMWQGGVDGVERFHEWLAEERVYLEGLKKAPKTNHETLEIEYVQRVVNLSASQAKYRMVTLEAKRARGDDGTYALGTSKAEVAGRHAQEKMEKDLEHMQELEEVLDIVERWTMTSLKWIVTLLIVERIFELTKMNQSQTGYKMCKHIAKALQARLKAVKNAIKRYNAAASALEPLMLTLSWEQVVEYMFLADFDILQDTCVAVQSKPRSRPAYQLAMDHYFKILCTYEEIKRLNIEIRRVVTWIRDKNQFLQKMEKILKKTEGKLEE